MKKLAYIIIAALALTSCDKLIDGVVHTVEFPEHTPKISATFIASDADSVLYVMLSSSAAVLDPAGPKMLEGAVVTLEDSEGTVLHSLSSANFIDSLYVLDLGTQLGTLEGEMTLRASAPEFEDVEASTTMPSEFVATIEYIPFADTMPTPWGIEIVNDRITIDLPNSTDKHECYVVTIEEKYYDEFAGEETDWNLAWVQTRPDTRIEEHWTIDGVLISDETVPNNSNGLDQLLLYTENYSDIEGGRQKTKVRIRIQSVSDELERFYRSVELWQNNEFSFFSEPMLMYSNVSSGFGCFGLATESVYEFEIE